MAGIYTILYKWTYPYYRNILICLLVVLFFVVGYYGYRRFRINISEKYKNVANANVRNPEIVIYFFYADWCPHCTNSKPEWSSFSSEYNNKIVNNYRIVCRMVNCTDDTEPEASQLMSLYKVTSFPTVIMVKDENTIVYDAKIKRNTLESFVISATSS